MEDEYNGINYLYVLNDRGNDLRKVIFHGDSKKRQRWRQKIKKQKRLSRGK